MNKILRTDPKAEYIELGHEIDRAIRRVLESGSYILGSEVAEFEAQFAEYIGVRYALGVASGTDAILLSLKACGIGPGDEVITVSHTAVATVAAIELSGAIPVLVDIDPATYTIAADKIAQAITPKTKAIIPVHLYGQPAELRTILHIAQEHKLLVIEDCAQAHGAEFMGKKVGSWGNVSAFSFYPTKNLGAIGDGGMLVTDDPEIYKRAVLLRQYGWEQPYISQIPGYNSRLDPLQAAILKVKLRYLDEWNARRINIAHVYSELLNGVVGTPQVRPASKHIFHLYVVTCQERDKLSAFLAEHGIATSITYPVPVHLQPAYTDRISTSGGLPVTERICPQILSLPIYPQIKEDQVRVVAKQVLVFYQSLSS
jgi:dTDP-3-amino-3,4,6-trideoxy-alpha-D-glucose transaminase